MTCRVAGCDRPVVVRKHELCKRHHHRLLRYGDPTGKPVPRSGPAACGRGHPYPESRRPGRGDCAVCHQEAQRRRYQRDVGRHRELARDYGRAHRAEATARHRAWRADNVERVRATARQRATWRRLGKDAGAVAYARMIRRDPCSYCGSRATTVDHIVPTAAGGTNQWDNLAAACAPCNASKHARPLLSWLLEAA